MGLTLSPEVKMARRVIKKHNLTVPFDIDGLVTLYAKVLYKSFPVEGVDGICLNLKTPGKTPTVIVNENSARTRQKFTLAHELGHIIIPWHVGTIIDEVDKANAESNTQYWQLEQEANRFASELLAPFDWIYSLYKQDQDPHYLLLQIENTCGISNAAATIRLRNALAEMEHILIPGDLVLKLYEKHKDAAIVQSELSKSTGLSVDRIAHHMIQHLPGKIAYCIEKKGIVITSGSTAYSHVYHQWQGSEFKHDPYYFHKNYSTHNLNKINTHWWAFDYSLEIPEDNRTWREILDKIATDIAPQFGITKFKASINGKVSGAHGSWKQKHQHSNINGFIEDCVARFDNPEYGDLVRHPDFLAFIRARCEAFSHI